MSAPHQFSLTRAQQLAYQAILRHVREHGEAPSYEELAAALGVGKSRAYALVGMLKERGHVTALPNRARAIVVLPQAGTYTLPPETQRRLEAFCAARGEQPGAVVNDAVLLHIDEAERDGEAAAGLSAEARQ